MTGVLALAAGPGAVGSQAAAARPWVVAAAVGVAAWLLLAAPARSRLSGLAAPDRRVDGRPVRRVPAGAGRRAGRARSWLRRALTGGRDPRGTAATDLPAAVGELARLLGSGVPAAAAWAHCADRARDDPVGRVLLAAAGAAASGLGVADALDVGARLPGEAGADLAPLAGAWRVVELTGAPAADVLERVASALGDAADVRDARRTAMAAPVATARILGALPLMGLGLGQLMGASPVQVLVGTPTGRVSAVAGLAFAAAGAVWTRRLLRAAGGPG